MSEQGDLDEIRFIKQAVSEIRDSLNKKSIINKIVILFYIGMLTGFVVINFMKQTPKITKIENVLEKSSGLTCTILANNDANDSNDAYE